MKSIQETYDSLVKADDLLQRAVKSAKEALTALNEVPDHTGDITAVNVPQTWSYETDVEQVIERLEGRQQQYADIIWDLTQDWPDLLDEDGGDEGYERLREQQDRH